jgi:sulfur-carrier protein
VVATTSHEAAAIVSVAIPSPLRSYTGGDAEISVAVPVLAPEEPPQLRAVLAALDVRYPGFRFRIIDEQGQVRRHIKLFVGQALERDLSAPIPQGAEVMIVAALSGG